MAKLGAEAAGPFLVQVAAARKAQAAVLAQAAGKGGQMGLEGLTAAADDADAKFHDKTPPWGRARLPGLRRDGIL